MYRIFFGGSFMNLFTCLLNQAVTLSIFHVSPWLFGVIAVITLALGIVLFTVRPTITYVDTEGDVVIHKEKHPLWKKVSFTAQRRVERSLSVGQRFLVSQHQLIKQRFA